MKLAITYQQGILYLQSVTTFLPLNLFSCKVNLPQVKQSSRVAERLKTYDLRKIGKEKEISKLDEDTGYIPVSPPKINF